MPMKFCVVLKPPKSRPGEHDERSTISAKTFKLPNCSFTIKRQAVVRTFLFEEWNVTTARAQRPAKLALIDKNVTATGGEEGSQILARLFCLVLKQKVQFLPAFLVGCNTF